MVATGGKQSQITLVRKPEFQRDPLPVTFLYDGADPSTATILSQRNVRLSADAAVAAATDV